MTVDLATNARERVAFAKFDLDAIQRRIVGETPVEQMVGVSVEAFTPREAWYLADLRDAVRTGQLTGDTAPCEEE